MAKVKVGVFGADRGNECYIPQLFNDPDAELVAICDRKQVMLDRCRKDAEAAGRYDISYFTDFDDFINCDMDAVILVNNANEHVPFGIRLLESGRHIMSECLACANMQQAVHLTEAVEKSGKVYALAENYCYTPVRWEMRERYLRGDIGELMYAEGEYLHDCSSFWHNLTYGDRNHWRNLMPSTFYCSHSIGPILKMTGLRPVRVSAFETPNMPYMRAVGSTAGNCGMEIVTLENGAILKALHFGLKTVGNHFHYQLNGDRGAMVDAGGDQLRAYIEGDRGNGRGEYETYTPKPITEASVGTGHGGSDYYTTHYFIRSILGDEEAAKRSINVYEGLEMCIPGILGYRSIVEGNRPISIPNLRNKEEREAYRNDTFCTFPKLAGDQWVPNNIHNPEPIPDEVYEEQRRLWMEGGHG